VCEAMELVRKAAKQATPEHPEPASAAS
jgi:hypothetical protein